jgi:hypothetical protein
MSGPSLDELLKIFTLQSPKVKGKVYLVTGREDPEGEYRYSSTLSLTSALYGGGW